MPDDPAAVEEAIRRARETLGVRFRLHGRDPVYGLDCVGLVAFAAQREDDVPTGYALRNAKEAHWADLLDGFGQRRTGGPQRRGDVILARPGPAHCHLGLWTGHSLIHADARLGRVVETPGELPWPILGVWSLFEGA
jgi:murein DD-endopeptidase / murein LD-carboxypeptidase